MLMNICDSVHRVSVADTPLDRQVICFQSGLFDTSTALKSLRSHLPINQEKYHTEAGKGE